MIRVSDIVSGFLHLIGWDQNYDTSDFLIASSLTQSDSGYKYQQAHPLLTLKNLKSIAPDYANSPYAVYIPGNQYYIGQTCSLANVSYRALTNNINIEPGTDPLTWEVFDAFSKWLEDKTVAGILSAVRSFLTMKMNSTEAKSILNNTFLYRGAGRLQDTVIATDSIVGFEIEQARSKGLTLKIERIGLQFVGTGDITIHIMHTSQVDPIESITLTRTKDGSMEWFTQTDLYLPYSSDSIDAGGSWYVVYNESELPAGNKAVNKDVDWRTGPCTTCGTSERQDYMAWSKFLKVYPIKALGINEQADPFEMWDINDNVYSSNNNYGINLEVSLLCDLTEFLVEQKSLFTDIIQSTVAISLLKELVYNPNSRINRSTFTASKQDIMYDLDGDSTSMKKSGMVYELSQRMKAVDINTRGISSVCMPCKKKGLRYRTIG